MMAPPRGGGGDWKFLRLCFGDSGKFWRNKQDCPASDWRRCGRGVGEAFWSREVRLGGRVDWLFFSCRGCKGGLLPGEYPTCEPPKASEVTSPAVTYCKQNISESMRRPRLGKLQRDGGGFIVRKREQ